MKQSDAEEQISERNGSSLSQAQGLTRLLPPPNAHDYLLGSPLFPSFTLGLFFRLHLHPLEGF
jgi:hypothetical protein